MVKKLREVSTILSRKLLLSVNIICTENKWKIAFFKNEAFLSDKTVANQEKVSSFSKSAPPNQLKKLFTKKDVGYLDII